MAGQHNVPAQEVFLEENGCNVGGCSPSDVVINFELVNQTSHLGLTKDIAVGARGFGFISWPVLAVS